MNLVDMSKIKNIQLILFYDTIQLKNISLSVIDYIFKQEKDKLNFFSNFETNFFIVCTLPSITNISLYDLKNNVESLKEENKKILGK